MDRDEREAFAVYYGADYYGRNFFPDTTNTTHPGTIIGFGGPGSPNTNNRAIQQVTFDWLETFWKNPKYGALQSYVQYSYLTRAPWYVAPDAPKNAHLSMVYFGFPLRFALDFRHAASCALPELARLCEDSLQFRLGADRKKGRGFTKMATAQPNTPGSVVHSPRYGTSQSAS